MLPVFTLPLALAGLAALPTLAAIYWLRNRFRRQPVSSLMLWADHRQIREGGTRRHRLQTPLVFYLELLALLLLAAAAAGPHVQTAPGTRPLIVVLDDSYSMKAGGDDSSRQRAIAELTKDIRENSYSSVRFLLAGDSPQFLGDSIRSVSDAERQWSDWKCQSPRCRMEDTLGLATELAGDRALILVVTDHKPEVDPGKGRLVWRAFGRQSPNLAFVNAARTPRDGGERCFLEIANLAEVSQSTTLRVIAGERANEVQQSRLTLSPHEIRRIFLDLQTGTPALTARLDDDVLDVDNRAILLPTTSKPVRVDLQVQNKALRQLAEKAIGATPGTELSAVNPHWLITDRDALRPEGAETWWLYITMEKDADAYTGPFIMDRSHPLTQGLQLQGVVWGAGKTETLPGSPVLMAGNVPLLTVAGGSNDRQDVRLRLRPELSTLPESPNWPILFWNLVQWRAAAEPGLSRINLRLGEDTTLTLPASRETVEVVDPKGKAHTQAVQGRRVTLHGDNVGVYQVRAAEERHTFAVNALNGDESDLRNCMTGRWGDWLDDTTLRLEYQNIAWVLLLAVCALLTMHTFIIARQAVRGRV